MISKAWSWIKTYLIEGMAAILAVALVWGAIQSHKAHEAQSQVKALSEALSASEANAELLRKDNAAVAAAGQVHSDAINTANTKEAQSHAVVTKALDQHRAWADEPVPTDVLNSLQ